MVEEKKKFSIDKSKFIYTFVICLFFMITLVFYGPLSLYLANSQEFWFNLKNVLHVIVPMSLISLVCSTLFLLFTGKLGEFLTKLLLGITLGLYIQGTYINIKYGTGVMDGSAIEWGNYTKYGIIDTAVWVALILLPFIIGKLFKSKERTILTLMALFLTVVQIPAMAVQLINYNPNVQEGIVSTDKGADVFASEENIIVFGLDTMDEVYYKEFIDNHPEYVENLEGFVHYDNNVTAAARTIMAVPALLTGQPYLRQSTYSDYLETIWSKETPISILHDNGYNVGIYTSTGYYSKNAVQYIDNFELEEEGRVGSYWILAKKLYKLTLFTFMPHYAKPRFEIDTAEFHSAKPEDQFVVGDDIAFYNDYVKDGASISNEYKKAFRFFLIQAAHPPYTINSDIEKGKAVDNPKEQIEAAMKITEKFLDNLRELGIYDSSTIIITADHGDLHAAEHSMLLIKRANAKGAYTTSHIPTSHYDLPYLFCNLAGADMPNNVYGMALDEITEDMYRERFCYTNSSGNANVSVREYRVVGDVGKEESVTLNETFVYGTTPDTPVPLGQTLTFDMDATANVYIVQGISGTTGWRSKFRGPHSQLTMPIEDLPEDGNLNVTLGLSVVARVSEMVIKLNDVEVYHDVIRKRDGHQDMVLTAPIKDVFTDDNVLNIYFDFPELSEDEMSLAELKRTETISLSAITVDVDKSK